MDAPELGKLLCEHNIITKEQLNKALKFQEEVGGRLPIILIKMGIVGEKTLVKFFSEEQSLPIVDLDELILPVKLIRRIPKDVIERHQILPVAWDQKTETLTVATFDPYDIQALEEVQIAVDCRVLINLATRSSIIRKIDHFFYSEGDRGVLDELEKAGEKKTANSSLPPGWSEALLPLLLEKGVVTKEELERKVRELGLGSPERIGEGR